VKNRRDFLLLGGLFLALILFVAFGPGRRPDQDYSGVPTTHSSEDGGALAFYEWAREIGYDARRLEYRSFALEESDAALVILNPGEPITRVQARDTLDWVARGGTLIFADDTPIVFGASRALLDELGASFEVYSTTTTIERAAPGQPALDQPLAVAPLVRTGRMIRFQHDDYVKIAGLPDAIVIAGVKHGSGYVYLSTATYPFTNAGLRDADNAALVLNLLRRVPPGGRIQFDEYHHGFFEPPWTGSLVLGSPWGWAATYAVIATALYLILSGRRFGRPIPLKEEVARRSSAEYVESMADLFQRGGKRAYILRHYYDAFKRRIARPYGVNPRLEDEEFVRELARFHEFDEPVLLALLRRMRSQQVGEDELVRTVTDAEELLATTARNR
jgi:hypothetical protein